jgi:thiol:disulfide interchange protein
MAEENKQNTQPEVEKKSAGNVLKKVFKVILGLVFLGLGIWLIWLFRDQLLVVVKGCIGLFLVLIGLITIAIARD